MKKNKLIYSVTAVVIIIAVIILIAVAIINKNSKKVSTQEADKAQITAAPLPTEQELSSVNLENSDKAQYITDKFALSGYDIIDNGITYNYQASEVTSGWRLTLTAKAMNEADFNAALPKGDTQNAVFNENISAVFIDRTINYVSDSYQITPQLQQNIDDGKTELERGNSIERELIPVQRIYWYKDGISYTLESRYRSYTIDDMTKLVQAFLDSNK